ncbi:Putative ubiquitin-conjugating enzyme E2, ubiquitin-conjugating enzyme/RWD [Septoria linicola]|uniref:Ubiquitin-conjugating enzyme E2, ubiquitin-conjugating enzyme/RWD n=1 Tax=Septoria linicola TaxID=215465 RepID=A0A9Q9ATG4_9PEZI|nr:putative ubiquitin-conjugating enzyme E2, ubiquitin-conjugating enzyme/RWD [Septoria linicola]USW55114.1 Putative ubiquitin-conjugating enzyme E2, ubiquitin-conjugating enzyme/RWD [Septoria linicola]
MATKAAHKRLTREYATLQKSPPEYITARPSESNILEWHYILTGPPDSPYHNGQYWGTLTFPSEYPFAPPAIRMHTPSGRFKCSERLCLSISDFHPKSFNPAWEVSTILLGVLSFMTSEEMTTGSIRGTEAERKVLANRTRWWNSTGGGSTTRTLDGKPAHQRTGFGAIKAGDGGKRFREMWPEEDEENWKWMEKEGVDPQTGSRVVDVNVAPELGQAQEKGKAAVKVPKAEQEPQGWFAKNKYWVIGGVLFAYVMAARLLKDQQEIS